MGGARVGQGPGTKEVVLEDFSERWHLGSAPTQLGGCPDPGSVDKAALHKVHG